MSRKEDNKKKIVERLEKANIDLSIKEISRQTGLHRNTVSNLIPELKDEGKVVKTRDVDRAKLFTTT